MARTFICGFEDTGWADVFSHNGTVSIQSTIKRSGNYALRSNPTNSIGSVSLSSSLSSGLFVPLARSFRIYMRVATLPNQTTDIVTLFRNLSPSYYVYVRLLSDGKISVGNPTGGYQTSTSALSADGLWHRIELDCGYYTGGNGARVYVDGTLWVTNDSVVIQSGSAASQITIGVQTANTTADLYFDDLLTDTESFSVTGLPGAGQAVLLLPISPDSSIGTWLAGAGGSSNLYDAVNNLPPGGLTTPTNASQIKNASKGTNDCTFNVQSYTAGGIGASDTINAVMALCRDAEVVSTGNKTGNVWIASNPAQSPANQFNYGDPATVMGDYPTGWEFHAGPTTAAPSVTKGTSPTVTIRKDENTTREAHCCFIGVYVDYTPATSQIKVAAGVAQASCKNIAGVAIASVKKFEGVQNV